MIFKRFFTWFTWSLKMAPIKKAWMSYVLLFWPVLAVIFLELLMPNSSIGRWCLAGAGYYGFLLIGTYIYISPKRNWRIILDKAEKKAKEIGGIPAEFQPVFEVLKDQTKKSQNPDKLNSFMSLIEQLKDRQEAVAELEQELSQKSNEQWLDEEVARFRKKLETRVTEIPGAIEAQGMSIRTVKSCIYRLLKED